MSRNDITGDNLQSRPNSKAFDENFDKIFGKKCPVCNGRGSVMEGAYPFEHYEQCPMCLGSRKVSA